MSSQNLPPDDKPLKYYHESWWKVENEPIWYLAGKSGSYAVGKWYFGDETSNLNGPYDNRQLAIAALKAHSEHL